MQPTEMTDREALTICDKVRDDIMTQDRSLYDRLCESNAIARIMNIAQTIIEQTEQKEQKHS